MSGSGQDMILVKAQMNVRLSGTDPEIRKFKMKKSGITFAALEKKIQKIFCSLNGININIKYKDEDGDLVVFSSDEELNIGLEESAKNGKFRVYVEENRYMSW